VQIGLFYALFFSFNFIALSLNSRLSVELKAAPALVSPAREVQIYIQSIYLIHLFIFLLSILMEDGAPVNLISVP
jgi:hypothetical protein